MEAPKKEMDRWIAAHWSQMLARWKELLCLGGTANEAQAMERVAGQLQQWFAEECRCQLLETGPKCPKLLVADWGPWGRQDDQGNQSDRNGAACPNRQENRIGEGNALRRVVLSGHYDTVFACGQEQQRVRLDEEAGCMEGPGALDMKGGIIAAMYAVKLLSLLRAEGVCVRILLAGDEETGHPGSRTAELLAEYSRGALFAFNLETGFLNADVCIGRKGTAECYLNVKGVQSHPGNDFARGRNAILEMCSKLEEISALTQVEKGLTVSPGRIQGGSAVNIIPDACSAALDLRFSSMADFEQLQRNIHSICAVPGIEGTSVQMQLGELLPPFETTDGVRELLRFVQEMARELQLSVPQGHYRGGASDAAHIGNAGVPVLCSMGVSGEYSHSEQEYALLSSLKDRIKLIAWAIAQSARFGGTDEV